MRFWKRDLYLTGTVRSGRKLFNYNLKNSPAQTSKGGRTPNEKRSAASRHVFKIRTHCFLCVYAHRRRHSASVRSAQQRLRTRFKFLQHHRAPSALFILNNIYIYAFSRRFYPKRLTIVFRLYNFISIFVPWESNPQPFALLTQCSTTEPHRNTNNIIFVSNRC